MGESWKKYRKLEGERVSICLENPFCLFRQNVQLKYFDGLAIDFLDILITAHIYPRKK